METSNSLLDADIIREQKPVWAFSRKVFCEGIRDGVPIALGYFAVSFSLGIAARKAGFTPFQGFLASLLNNASAGEYAAFALIMSGASYFQVAVITLIANARYLLMSCALAQRFAPGTPFWHRLVIGYDVTDELFGITIARPGSLNPCYTYGAILLAAPAWASGTALGIVAGNLLPLRAVSALSVALYGMFLAIIIPPARKDKVVAVLVAISFALSFACNYLPGISALSDGTRTILLTVLISSVAAVLFPVKDQETEHDASQLHLHCGHGTGVVCDPHPAAYSDPQTHQEPVRSVVPVLCALCHAGRHDLPGHRAGHPEPGGRCCGAGDRHCSGLVRCKPVPGGCGLLRCGLCAGILPLKKCSCALKLSLWGAVAFLTAQNMLY